MSPSQAHAFIENEILKLQTLPIYQGMHRIIREQAIAQLRQTEPFLITTLGGGYAPDVEYVFVEGDDLTRYTNPALIGKQVQYFREGFLQSHSVYTHDISTGTILPTAPYMPGETIRFIIQSSL